MLSFFSCENEDFLWKGDTYARIEGPSEWTLDSDSLIFSFAPYVSEFTEITMDSRVYITGEVADKDRTVNIAVDNEKTTASDKHYSFNGSLIIKAGEHYASLPVTLFRTDDLQSKSVKLVLKISESGEIKPGVKEWSNISILWSDMISKPANWENMTEFFGTYSDTKYRFIIDVLGLGTFTYGEINGMTWGEMNHFKIKLVNALNEYNNANPQFPLTDEFNQLVKF